MSSQKSEELNVIESAAAEETFEMGAVSLALSMARYAEHLTERQIEQSSDEFQSFLQSSREALMRTAG